jgi:hypothetical protein
MLAIIFIALAAVCKSISDTLQHHFDSSVFAELNKRFWDPAFSWKFVKFLPFTKYRPDAWHLSNSGMILFFTLAVCFNDLSWHPVWQIAAMGSVFVFVFNIFYNKIWSLE